MEHGQAPKVEKDIDQAPKVEKDIDQGHEVEKDIDQGHGQKMSFIAKILIGITKVLIGQWNRSE